MIQRVFRGPERIRTAVEAFAELCLAARPQDHFDLRFLSMYNKNPERVAKIRFF